VDLNLLYSQHQILLMRAATAGSREMRIGHESDAHGLAHRIKAFQLEVGAPAAGAWGHAL
jgi:hypothetical protein